jgi:hypothetical protein
VDLSKLPRLSSSEKPPAPPSTQQPSQPAGEPKNVAAFPPPITNNYRQGIGPEVWIGVAVGLLLIAISRHFPAYVFDRLTGRPYHTGITFVSDGTEVPYPQVEGFAMLSDAAVFSFGVAMVAEALLLLLAVMASGIVMRAAMILAICLTLAATLFNLFVSIKLLQADVMPQLSGLAVLFGGYMVFEQFRTLRSAP